MTDNPPRRLLLNPEQLYRHCDASQFEFETTEDVSPLVGMIGQDRATRATEFGLGITGSGYNVYMAGRPGTGKTTHAVDVASRLAARRPPARDWVYVYNFDNPDEPRAESLPPGRGRKFRAAMETMVEDLLEEIPKVFGSEDYEDQRQGVLNKFQGRTRKILADAEEEARELRFSLKRTSTGFATLPLKEDGTPLPREEFALLSAEERQEIEERGRKAQLIVSDALRQVNVVEAEARERLRALEKEVALFTIDPIIKRVADEFSRQPHIVAYMDRVKGDVVEHLRLFKQGTDLSAPAPGPVPGGARRSEPDLERALRRYRVNCIVDHSASTGAPVVVESNPVYYNLVGKMEYVGQMGSLTTDHTMIRPGALHQANGGYLVVQARDVLTAYGSWDALKRALRTGRITIEPIGEQHRLLPTKSIVPEPIPLDVKVILIGNPMLYHLLHTHDEDFPKLFKIMADFDVEMGRTSENAMGYARFIASLVRRDGLRHFHRSGVARVIEYSSRLAGDKNKVSAQFNEVVEILYEANAWADAEGADIVEASHVSRAIAEKTYRSNQVEEKVQEAITRGNILIDVDGAVTGQVNGLAVYGIGDYHFGRPSRITARTYMGERGIVNIEREAALSGRIHNKGVLTLAGYLGGKYAQTMPLSLSASITFEQTYGGVDGDSASSTELYALLSALGELPINQGIAVTGSIDQFGRIQPIGGVNEKIEGFFYVCKIAGLTGDQGVIIPVQNVDNLMLDDEVIQAVSRGKFHVWAISDVDEGLEILTGVPAGVPGDDGTYPPETVHGRVSRRLLEYARGLRTFGRTVVGISAAASGDGPVPPPQPIPPPPAPPPPPELPETDG